MGKMPLNTRIHHFSYIPKRNAAYFNYFSVFGPTYVWAYLRLVLLTFGPTYVWSYLRLCLLAFGLPFTSLFATFLCSPFAVEFSCFSAATPACARSAFARSAFDSAD